MNSIRDKDSCTRASGLLRQGFPIGTYIRGVCGLWADGDNGQGLDALYRIKGERRGSRPVGTTLTAPEFIELLHPDKISPSAKGLLLSEHKLVRRLGSLCFIRAPVRGEAGKSMPDRLVSRSEDGTYWIQNWLPEGCLSAVAWMDSMREQGVSLPVATSMNVSGEPEIVDQERGRQFCMVNDVPMFLSDPGNPGRARGSFPIIQIDHRGITLIREGHFSAQVFQSLLWGWDIDLTSYQKSKFPPVEFPQPGAEQEPGKLRRRLLKALDG